MLSDVHLVERARRMIREEKTAAEWAVRKSLDQIQAVFEKIEDPYFRDRKSDVALVGERLLRTLVGRRRVGVGRARAQGEHRRGARAVAGGRRAARSRRSGRLLHRRGRAHLAHRHRGAGAGSALRRRCRGARAQGLVGDDDGHRRPPGRGDPRSRRRGAAAVRGARRRSPRAGAAAGGHPRRPLADHRRHGRPPARQRRDAGGDPHRRRSGGRIGGAVPHRVPLPRTQRAAVGGRAVRARRGGAPQRGRPADHLPHPGSRRRQAAAVGAHAGRDQPGDGAAVDPLLAPPHRRLQDPAPRAPPRRRGGTDADPAAADLGRGGAARRPSSSACRWSKSCSARGSPTSPRSRSAS